MEPSVRTWMLFTNIGESKIKSISENREWQFFNMKLYERTQYGDIIYIYCHKLSCVQFIATVEDAEMAFTAGVNRLKIERVNIGEGKVDATLLSEDRNDKSRIQEISNNEDLLNLVDPMFCLYRQELLTRGNSHYVQNRRKKRGKKELILECIIGVLIGVVIPSFIFGDLLFIICAFLGLLGMTVLLIL